MHATGFPPKVEKYPPSLSETSLLHSAHHSAHGEAIAERFADCEDVGGGAEVLEAPHVVAGPAQP